MYSSYNYLDWLLFFYIYCFLGWIIESTYVSVRTVQIVNRGFLKGPAIPIYGFGAIIILHATLPFRSNPLLVFWLGIFAASLLEFITGYVMEKLFKMRYWDYSDRKFNLCGYICLFNSICWGFLSLLMVYLVHSPLEFVVLRLNYVWLVAIVSGISSLFIVDVIGSSNAAIELRNLLINSDKLKHELVVLHNRLDEWNDKIEDNKRKAREFRETMSNKDMYAEVRAYLNNLKAEHEDLIPDNIEEAMENITNKYRRTMYELDKRKSVLLRSNPTAKSGKFAAILDEIKDNVEKYGRKKK